MEAYSGFDRVLWCLVSIRGGTWRVGGLSNWLL